MKAQGDGKLTAAQVAELWALIDAHTEAQVELCRVFLSTAATDDAIAGAIKGARNKRNTLRRYINELKESEQYLEHKSVREK